MYVCENITRRKSVCEKLTSANWIVWLKLRPETTQRALCLAGVITVKASSAEPKRRQTERAHTQWERESASLRQSARTDVPCGLFSVLLRWWWQHCTICTHNCSYAAAAAVAVAAYCNCKLQDSCGLRARALTLRSLTCFDSLIGQPKGSMIIIHNANVAIRRSW